MASVSIHIPQYTKGKNPLMYVTGVHTDQVRAAELPVKCAPWKYPHEVGVIMPGIL